jgi:hypothetical protein
MHRPYARNEFLLVIVLWTLFLGFTGGVRHNHTCQRGG